MSLARLLREQQQRLDGILDLLRQERTLLSSAEIDSERLADLAKGKQELLAKLEASETLRQGVQRRLGYADGASGARQAAADAGCEAEWAHTLELTREAQRLNTLNGELVGLRMEQNTRLLDFIHQAAEKTVYRASGQVAAQPGRINASV
ncbi:flagella synthesis protein FlgN [Billgrantia kenyensis]|uniref:Flagellar protein FlgN n=1 Tax=Billgrantia kenyensis TaxID=321266 RepID=A0A7V9W1V1_9GAMM|nr:flagellar protein FlgN [Halomonas kenyensis]MBA2779504.1 flagellar protein FlgN [Halomonas kenyensis]MCG6662737.1 flagellar protein FlgN [Halomonas kenyensis]